MMKGDIVSKQVGQPYPRLKSNAVHAESLFEIVGFPRIWIMWSRKGHAAFPFLFLGYCWFCCWSLSCCSACDAAVAAAAAVVAAAAAVGESVAAVVVAPGL